MWNEACPKPQCPNPVSYGHQVSIGSLQYMTPQQDQRNHRFEPIQLNLTSFSEEAEANRGQGAAQVHRTRKWELVLRPGTLDSHAHSMANYLIPFPLKQRLSQPQRPRQEEGLTQST